MTNTRIGTQAPQDRASAFYQAASWIAPNRPTVADQAYAPGKTAHFTWTMVAPEVDVATTYDESFQMLEEGVTWFGPTQDHARHREFARHATSTVAPMAQVGEGADARRTAAVPDGSSSCWRLCARQEAADGLALAALEAVVTQDRVRSRYGC